MKTRWFSSAIRLCFKDQNKPPKPYAYEGLPLPIPIVLADDHALFRQGFKSYLQQTASCQMRVVAEAANGRELLRAVEHHQPQVVITDVQMPGLSGLEATRIIQRELPHISVLALSMSEDRATVLQMFSAGAKGYLVKSGDPEEILEAIETVARGETYYGPFTACLLASVYTLQKAKALKKTRQTTLCEKELRIVQLICRQLSTKEIAAELRLSNRTIDDYRHKILEKTGAKNMVGIALYAVKNGLVTAGELDE